jgi:predicted flap endonuclease-1-like 5' DNA nuclease
MGQPIYLEREEEKLTTYGPNQTRTMIAQGWKPAGEEETVVDSFGPVDDLTKIKGVGESTAAILADAGYYSYVSIVDAPLDKLVALNGISLLFAQKIQKNAAELV